MDYRDKLRKLVEAECKRQGITRKAWCQNQGILPSTLSLVFTKRREANILTLEEWLSLLGYELVFKRVTGPGFGPGRKRGRAKVNEGVSFPRRLPGRPKGAKDLAPRKAKRVC